MPTFQVDLQTKAGTTYISNIYHVNAADLLAAMTQAQEIAFIQAVTIPSFWSIDYARVSTPAPGDGAYLAKPLNQPGTRGTPGQLLPYFNRFRVTFSVGFRRPLVKYLIGVGENDVDGSDFVSGTLTEINTNYVNALVNSVTIDLVGPTGLPVISGGLAREVGMRQLRRASKRKTPVIGP